MKALVIFDTVAQDTALAMELTREMEELGWTELEYFSYAFEKEAEGHYDEVEALIIANVDAATFEAEWQNVNYLYVIGNEAPKFKVSAGEQFLGRKCTGGAYKVLHLYHFQENQSFSEKSYS